MSPEIFGGVIVISIAFAVFVFYKISKGAKAEEQVKTLKKSQKKGKKINEKLAEKDNEFKKSKKKNRKGRTSTDRDIKPWWLR